MWSPRLSLSELAGLSRRLAIALGAGLPLRSVWARETQSARRAPVRAAMREVLDALDRGDPPGQAVAAAGAFPELFSQIVAAGDQSGHLPEAFGRLADHYETQLALRRSFLVAMAWRLLEEGLAELVSGLLMYIQGWVAEGRGTPVDVLGWGLAGARGLAIYVLAVCGVIALGALWLQAVRRGLRAGTVLQRVLMAVPAIGRALRTLALSRLAWTLGLALDSGMPVRQAVALAVGSTQNAVFTRHLRRMEHSVEAGQSLTDTFADTGAFPPEFLELVAMGEESGELVEALGRASRMYHAQAEAALRVLVIVAGLLCWMAVALVLIGMIFHIFSGYVQTLRSAL